MRPNPFEQVLIAQTRNSALSGANLRAAGVALARVARSECLSLLSADGSGERIIGSAVSQDDGLPLVDSSRRLDGMDVLLVAGFQAGTAGLTEKARLCRSLGARRVDAAFLPEEGQVVSGCDQVWALSVGQPRLVAL